MNERLFLLWRGKVYSQTGWEPWRISPGSATASLYRLSTLRSKRLSRARNFSLPPTDNRDFLIQKPLPKHILSTFIPLLLLSGLFSDGTRRYGVPAPFFLTKKKKFLILI